MTVLLILSVIAGLLWLAVSRKAVWRERARNAENANEAVRKANAVKNTVVRDASFRQRVRDHFDLS